MIKPKLKRICLITTYIFLLTTSLLSAQKLEAGLRFTPQATSYRYDTWIPLADYLKATPYYFRIRTAQGAGVLYRPFERWNIGADLLYSLQGGGYEERKSNVNYLKVPIWIGYNSSYSKRLIFNFQTGVDVGILVRAKMKFEGGESMNISRYLNRLNYGIPVAFGVKYKIAPRCYLNNQLFFYTDFQTLSKTNREFTAKNYIVPALRISLDYAVNSDQ